MSFRSVTDGKRIDPCSGEVAIDWFAEVLEVGQRSDATAGAHDRHQSLRPCQQYGWSLQGLVRQLDDSAWPDSGAAMSDWQHFAHGADIGARRRDAGLQLSMSRRGTQHVVS
jgi:hypothetical protein